MGQLLPKVPNAHKKKRERCLTIMTTSSSVDPPDVSSDEHGPEKEE